MQVTTKPIPFPHRLALVLGSFLAYVLVFPTAYRFIGATAISLMIFPVCGYGWLLGRWYGVGAGLATVPLRAALLMWTGEQELSWSDHLFRSAVMCTAGYLVGYVGELLAKLQEEVAERRKSEAIAHTQERRLHMLLRQMPVILWTTDRDLFFTTGIGAALSDMGMDAAKGPGLTLEEFFRPDNPAFSPSEASRRALNGEAVAATYHWHDRTYQVRVEPLLDSGRAVVGTLGIALDVTQQNQTEAALYEVEERFRSAFDHAHVGIALVEFTGQCTRVNRALCAMVGYEWDELVERIRAVVHPDDLARVAAQVMSTVAAGGESLEVEARLVHRLGHNVWTLASIAVVRDDAGHPGYLICQIQDITDRKRYEEHLRYQADHDSLTGLINRRRFREELQVHVKTGHGVLLFIDLDGFKQVNDLLGHEAGDELLRDVSVMLRQALRPGEIIGRLGGDEFVVLLPEAETDRAIDVIHHVQDGLRQLVVLFGDSPITVTASGGLARYPEHGLTPEELLARADMAMYEAKESGRNGLVEFSPNNARPALKHQRSLWESRIRKALERDGFELHAQPVIDLETGRVAWQELLLRMRDEEGELITPGAFLPIAERLGMIHAIDHWVVGQAVRLLQADPQLKVSINLSGRSVASNELAMYTEQCLRHTGVDPARLMLEVTETAAILDWEGARQFMYRLKALGCRFALDDFGAGYASFHQLKRLPVDCLKIDGHLVKRLPEFPADQHVVRAIAEMANGLGLVAVAEFVEDEETLSILRQCGVAYGQGYHIGRPGPLARLPIA